MDLIIKTRIDSTLKDVPSVRLFAMRKLSEKEIRRIRRAGIRRLYLPSMTEECRDEFLRMFDRFWDGLVKDYSADHFFWRNAVSSKMQEWEYSIAYLLLTLFALAKDKTQNQSPVLVIVSSFEEAEVCKQWALRQKWNIVSSDGKVRMCFLRHVQELKSTLYFGYYLFSTCHKKLFSPRLKYAAQLRDDGKNVLIATLSYPGSFNCGQYKDPFFGDFQDRLTGLDYKSLYITDLLTSSDKKTSMAIDACKCDNIQIVCSILSWRQIIGTVFKLFFRRLKVRQACFADINVAKLVEWNFRRFTHGFNINAEIFYEAVKKTCYDCNFNKLVLIFEGNVFERASIQAFRGSSTNGVVCGYSHGVIFDLNLKLRLTDQEKQNRPEPDYFVCSGAHGKKLLQEVGARFEDKVFDGCSLRGVPQIQRQAESRKTSKTILVALDGFWTSSRLLDWIIECKDLFAEYDVIIRCHPNVSTEKILQQTIGLLPEKFRVSGESLDNAMRKSLCVLYRHTSVGMQALLNGIPAIHLAVDAPLSADPIRGLRKGKWTVYDRHGLQEALSAIERFRGENREGVLDEASQYVQEYFSLPTEERIKQFIGQ